MYQGGKCMKHVSVVHLHCKCSLPPEIGAELFIRWDRVETKWIMEERKKEKKKTQKLANGSQSIGCDAHMMIGQEKWVQKIMII